MTTRLNMSRDINTNLVSSLGGRPFSSQTVSFLLPASTPVTFSPPANCNFAFFSYAIETPVDVWVDINEDANLPNLGGTASLFLLEDGDQLLLEDSNNLLLESNSQEGTLTLNPVCRSLENVSEISFFADAQTYVAVDFYEIVGTAF